MKKTILILPFFALFLFLLSCNKESSDKSRFTVYLTDAPGDYEEINIRVREVQVKATADNGEDGWITLPLSINSPLNLLDFQNGKDALLTTAELSLGKISQLRLILEESGNTIKVEGNTQPIMLETPSASQSGLKLQIHAELTPDIEYKIWLDWDAARSVVHTGNDKYILKPVIRTFTEATGGTLKGIIQPLDAQAKVIISNGDPAMDIQAIADPVTGQFIVRGLASGTYTITIDGVDPYIDQTKTSIMIEKEKVTDMGTITLSK